MYEIFEVDYDSCHDKISTLHHEMTILDEAKINKLAETSTLQALRKEIHQVSVIIIIW